MSSSHQKLIDEILSIIERRRPTYSGVSIKSALVKRDDAWWNYATKILPLHRSEQGVKKSMNYGNFALIEDFLSLSEFIEIIKKLPYDASVEIVLGDHKVRVEGHFVDGYKYDSGDDYLGIGWFFERYQYRPNSNPSNPKEPLVSSELPLFPRVHDAINEFIGIDLSRYSDSYGLLICLPNYGARIQEFRIGTTVVSIKVQALEVNEKDLVGKSYFEGEGKTMHQDILFENSSGQATLGFNPDRLHIALISRTTNEMIDRRDIYLSWQTLPRGVVVDIPEYEIMEMIQHGETETLEYKEGLGKPEEFAETVVAFANGIGGIVLLGVDDHAKVVGMTDPRIEDTIANVLRSHCEEPVEYNVERRKLGQREVIIIRVDEGEDKPYFVRDRGPYVRANGTDRIMSRYELDEIYREKYSEQSTLRY